MLASQVLEILIWHTQQKQLRRLVARPFGRPLSGRRWHPHTITRRRPKISSPKIKIYSNTTDLGCMRRPGRFVVRGVHDGRPDFFFFPPLKGRPVCHAQNCQQQFRCPAHGSGKTLAVIGMGSIATELITRAKGMQMKIVGWSRYVSFC